MMTFIVSGYFWVGSFKDIYCNWNLQIECNRYFGCFNSTGHKQHFIKSQIAQNLKSDQCIKQHFTLKTTSCCCVSAKTAGVFHLRSSEGKYKLNFNQAQEACKAEGATLATFSQLSDAQQVWLHTSCIFGVVTAFELKVPKNIAAKKSSLSMYESQLIHRSHLQAEQLSLGWCDTFLRSNWIQVKTALGNYYFTLSRNSQKNRFFL